MYQFTRNVLNSKNKKRLYNSLKLYYNSRQIGNKNERELLNDSLSFAFVVATATKVDILITFSTIVWDLILLSPYVIGTIGVHVPLHQLQYRQEHLRPSLYRPLSLECYRHDNRL